MKNEKEKEGLRYALREGEARERKDERGRNKTSEGKGRKRVKC